MTTLADRLPWDAIGPVVFLLIAGALCFLLPEGDTSKGVLMVIGAALTRVRTIPTNNKPK